LHLLIFLLPEAYTRTPLSRIDPVGNPVCPPCIISYGSLRRSHRREFVSAFDVASPYNVPSEAYIWTPLSRIDSVGAHNTAMIGVLECCCQYVFRVSYRTVVCVAVTAGSLRAHLASHLLISCHREHRDGLFPVSYFPIVPYGVGTNLYSRSFFGRIA
jgi:hypothetical protein